MQRESFPLVSVIIPAYNPPAVLFQACLQSVLDQDYPDLEIIVVDDGSNSDSAALMDDLADRNACIRVIHQENAGEGAARNKGLENASGEYLIFVDADDGLADKWIIDAVRLSEDEDADIVAGRVLQVDKVPKTKQPSALYSCRTFDIDELWQLQRDFLYDSTSLIDGIAYLDPGVCSKLIKRNCITDLRFPVGIKLSSDQVFNHAMLRRAKRYVITNELAYYYVSNTDSVSHVYNPSAVSIMMHSMELIRPLLLDNPEVVQAFCFRVIREICVAIQFSAFSDQHPLGYKERVDRVKEACSQPLLREALSHVDISKLPSRSWKAKAWLLKHKRASLYVLMKKLSDR